MKKLLSTLLTLSLIIGLCAGMAGGVFAGDYYGDEYYARDNGNGTCTITYNINGNRNVTEIYIPETVNGMRVTSISSWCFEDYDKLETVVIPEGVRDIGEYAFSGCQNLKSIRLPASLTHLASNVFEGSCFAEIKVGSRSKTFCAVDGVLFTKDMSTLLKYPQEKSGTSYAIPKGVMKIAEGAFSHCIHLTSITFPKTLTTIGNHSFATCESLEKLVLPDSVTNCGYDAFYGCSALRSVTLSNHMTSISAFMFYGCGFSSIVIPSSITAIGECAFAQCGDGSGVSFALPENLSSIGPFALSSASAISVDGNNPNYSAKNGILFSKDMTELIQYPVNSTARSYIIPSSVTAIGDAAFYGAHNLKSISIPDSVVSIGESAFGECGLTVLSIPQSIREIPRGAFCNCYNLNSVSLPDGLTRIGEYAFADAPIRWISLPDSLMFIDAYAFDYCYNLQKIILPDSLQKLGAGAFYECNSLTEVIIPFGITEISYYLFSGCDSLSRVVLPATVGYIDYDAFANCYSLSKLNFSGTEAQWDKMQINDWDPNAIVKTIPVQCSGTDYTDSLFCYVEDGYCGKMAVYDLTDLGRSASSLEVPQEINGKPVEAIAPYAFENCGNLEMAVLPEGITVLGNGAFKNCYSLKQISLPSTLTFIGANAFNYCPNLRNISIPAGVSSLGANAFQNSYALQQITLPDGLTEIDNETFLGCYGLTSIELPDSVTKIGSFSFAACSALTNVKLGANLRSIDESAFSGCESLQNITFPDSIRSIENWIFEGCSSLRWIYIPAEITQFYTTAVYSCSNLSEIFYEGSHAQWNALWGMDDLSEYCNATVYFDCAPVVSTFMDVKANDWFKDAVAYAYENELMNGTSDMLFSPSGSLTRGQLVTILYRVAGEPDVETAADFSDVPAGKYFSNAVAWAAENGIVNGYNDGTFKPDNKITREQIATILYRYKNPPEVAGTLDFPDAEKVSTYAKDAMTWAVSEGLITGIKSNGVTTLAPKNTATRAQIATIIMRYLEAE